jgi:F0F1-type ATP synthase assembly protein I
MGHCICYTSKKMDEKAAPQATPQTADNEKNYRPSVETASRQRNDFLALALNMSWQLAIVVVIPIVAGVYADKALGTSPLLLCVGLALALAGTVIVLWRTMQAANHLPVPKLSAADRERIQQEYRKEDED